MKTQYRDHFYSAIRENKPLFVATLMCIITNIIAAPYIPANFDFNSSIFTLYYSSWNGYTFAVVSMYLILYGLNLCGIDKNNKIKETVTAKNIISGAIASINIFICLYCFCLFKRLIPFINPYSWDPFLYNTDYILLFGVDLFKVIDNISSTENMKTICDIIYTSWAATSGAIILWQHLSPNRKLRMQYLTSWVATWAILGSIMAVIFSSAGPCFYSYFYPNTPLPIIEATNKLRDKSGNKDYTTDMTKRMLLETVSHKQDSYLGFGISAFPSLHVGTTTLNACLLTKINLKLGLLMWIYTLLIITSCVYLGFHYLVDCIAGTVGAICIWSIVGMHINREFKS